MRLLLAFLLVTFSISNSVLFCQSKVEVILQLLDEDIIADGCMKRDNLLAAVKQINSKFTETLEKTQGDYQLNCQFTISHNKDLGIEFSSRPKQSDSLLAFVETELSELKNLRTDRYRYSFICMATINGGCQNSKIDFEPELLSPNKADLKEFKKLSLVEQRDELIRWVSEDVLPLFAFFTHDVDKKFAGVKSVGEFLTEKEYLSKSVFDLTDANFNYWRASLEMERFNMVIPFVKVCLLIREGRFDYAGKFLFVTNLFSGKGSVAKILYSPLNDYLNVLDNSIAAEVKKGIAFHDEKKYSEAVEHYKKLKVDFPYNAWLNYEYYYSESSLHSMDSVGYFWNLHKSEIYGADPLYPYCAHAGNSNDGYEMYLRMSLSSLFSESDKLISDLVAYADAAFDLEQYAFAGQLYWLLYSHVDEKALGRKNILFYFLYCMEELGHAQLKSNFEGNFEKEFAKIRSTRKKIKESNSFYKSFGG
ncbi:MAG: hypothetical protein IPM74_03240 [Crocinitomicaceae bacterium]|nr:hypothetical protein [Crocinitomicaceae bacterium]MBK8924930.1 hypothetical protein [Crocinitomicaceae bacterium]